MNESRMAALTFNCISEKVHVYISSPSLSLEVQYDAADDLGQLKVHAPLWEPCVFSH